MFCFGCALIKSPRQMKREQRFDNTSSNLIVLEPNVSLNDSEYKFETLFDVLVKFKKCEIFDIFYSFGKTWVLKAPYKFPVFRLKWHWRTHVFVKNRFKIVPGQRDRIRGQTHSRRKYKVRKIKRKTYLFHKSDTEPYNF